VFFVDATEDTGSCRRQKLVPLQNSPSARGCKFLSWYVTRRKRSKRRVAVGQRRVD